MLAAIAILAQLAQPSPALTPETMDDLQAHAEAANRLARGEVLAPDLTLDPPEWAFEPMPFATSFPPIAELPAHANPFEPDEKISPFADGKPDPFEARAWFWWPEVRR